MVRVAVRAKAVRVGWTAMGAGAGVEVSAVVEMQEVVDINMVVLVEQVVEPVESYLSQQEQ